MQIRLLITGGTSDKTYNMHNGALHFVNSHMDDMLNEARCRLELEVEQLMLLDSLDMTEDDRAQIVAACEHCAESRIVITHGTDTMVDSARQLQQAISDKTIVLTGAMIPYVFDKSDALFNIGCALSAVQCLAPGVYIAMNGRIFPADNVIKNRDEGIFDTLG